LMAKRLEWTGTAASLALMRRAGRGRDRSLHDRLIRAFKLPSDIVHSTRLDPTCGRHLFSCHESRYVSRKVNAAFQSLAACPRMRFPITWNHVIEEESLNINKLEHVVIERVEQCSNCALSFALRSGRAMSRRQLSTGVIL